MEPRLVPFWALEGDGTAASRSQPRPAALDGRGPEVANPHGRGAHLRVFDPSRVFGPARGYVAAGSGSGLTRTVSATAMISSTGSAALDACSLIASGLDAW
jgi:hypothetical protein